VTEEGHRVFIYEHPKTGDVFTIPDPALQLNLLETVQRQVADLLEYGLAGKPPAPAPAPDTGEAEASDDQTDTLAAEEVVAESEPETTNA